MSAPAGQPPSFWRTLRLLLKTAQLRSRGRRERQKRLFLARAQRSAINFGAFGDAFIVALMVLANLLAAWVLCNALVAAERLEAERHGTIMVSAGFLHEVREAWPARPRSEPSSAEVSRILRRDTTAEARRIASETGRDAAEIRRGLLRAIAESGPDRLAAEPTPHTVLRTLPSNYRLPALLGSLVLGVWSVMLVFQGEGVELDIQRRRNPMWEWLFSHPVPPAAVFLAELLAPLAANPLYYSAPLFPAVLYGVTYGLWQGAVALLLVGVPLTVAAACLGKALETAVMLRCTPRTRGAILGVMSWLGYACLVLLFVLLNVNVGELVLGAAGPLWRLAAVPWPYFGLFLGRRPDGTWSMPLGVLTCGAGAMLTVAGSVAFTVWGARRGLAGATGGVRPASTARQRRDAGFGRWALYRKELLWLIRDRSAIVQIVLIPLSAASVQLVQLGPLAMHAGVGWSYVCGGGILLGTVFLSYLGPRSLASEGAALWIALTWPRGLESLLKAKALLWAVLASVVVGAVFATSALLHPADAWRIALLALGWMVFALSMSRKASTLAATTSESGEVERVPSGRRWAAQLGTLSFAFGVMSQQWNVAAAGVVYSILAAAAMWQGFRARLPFLYDRWSERLPPAPTLTHAMVGVSLLVEVGATLALSIALIAGREAMAAVYLVVYTAAAAAVAIGMAVFLRNRGAALTGILVWPTAAGRRVLPLTPALASGIALGAALAGIALLYLGVLHRIPGVAEMTAESDRQMAAIPHLREAYAAMAVLVAPFAEEFLFRGLLYRALDREWGRGWAVIGSAAFFAIYHPYLSWLPVGTLGALNAWLYKRTGRLASAVALHMVYNAVVVMGAVYV